MIADRVFRNVMASSFFPGKMMARRSESKLGNGEKNRVTEFLLFECFFLDVV